MTQKLPLLALLSLAALMAFLPIPIAAAPGASIGVFDGQQINGALPFDLPLALDGVDAYATTFSPDGDSLDLGIAETDDFTIEAFFYVPDLTNNTPDTLLWKQGAYGLYIVFSSSAADRVIFRIWTGPSSHNLIYYDVNLAAGWHHAAAVFDNEYSPAADLIALYLDGSQVAASDSAFEWTPGIPNSSSPLNVGGYLAVNPYAGLMDEIRLSDVVRYSGPSYTVPTEPFSGDANTRGLWHFDTFEGNLFFPDDSGEENHLWGLSGAQVGMSIPAPPPSPPPLPVVPMGKAFPIDPDAGQDPVGGRPAIAADGTNFLVVYLRGSAIVAARVSHAGGVLDPDGIVIGPGVGYPAYPSVAFDGTNYLVVWMQGDEIYGARVTPSGSVLDTPAIQLTTGANSRDRPPAIEFDGTNYLIVWRTWGDELYAARLSTSGVNLDGPAGFRIGHGKYPWVAFDGANYLAVWHDTGNGLDIYGNRIAADGTVLDGTGFVISNASENQDHASIAFDGTNYLVVWHDTRGGEDVAYNDGTAYGARVTPGGVVLDNPAIQIADNVRSQVPVVVAFDGTDYLVAWHVDMFQAKFRLHDVFGRRVSTSGTVLDDAAIPIATSVGHEFGPRIAFDANTYLVVWGNGLNSIRCLDGCVYGQLLQKQASAALTSQSVQPNRQGVTGGSQANPAQANGDWTVQPSGTIQDLEAIWGFDGSNVYAVGAFGGGFFSGEILRYDGSQWLTTPIETARLYGIWGSAPDDVWAAGLCFSLFHYDGQGWTFLNCGGLGEVERGPYPMALGMWGSSSTDILFVGTAGGVQRYDGAERFATYTDVSVDLWDIWGTSADDVYAVGEFGTVTRYDGSSWNQVSDIPSIQSLNGIWACSANDIFTVGDFGTILHYDGSSWSVQDSGTLEHLFGVWGFGPSDVYAVGRHGTVLHYDGISWAAETSGTDAHLMDAWGAGNSVWAVGDQGVILRKTLAGESADFDGDGFGDACDPDDDNDSNLAPAYTECKGPCPGGFWRDGIELYVGTDPVDPCADTTAANDEADDRWPPDFDDNQAVNVLDFSLWVADYPSPSKPLDPRADLNGSGAVNVLDFTAWKAYFGHTCLP